MSLTSHRTNEMRILPKTEGEICQLSKGLVQAFSAYFKNLITYAITATGFSYLDI